MSYRGMLIHWLQVMAMSCAVVIPCGLVVSAAFAGGLDAPGVWRNFWMSTAFSMTFMAVWNAYSVYKFEKKFPTFPEDK
jgi:hypothetical protein